MKIVGPSMHEFWIELSKWSQSTFGKDSDRGPYWSLEHLRKEADEAQVDPENIEEYADCLFLVLDAARRAGFTLDDLVDAAFDKLDVNRNRKWLEKTGNTLIEHIREATK